MTTDTIFKYELASNEIEAIKFFCNSVEYCSIDQFIGWQDLFHKTRCCFFLKYENEKIISFCLINESKLSANINFGPVCSDKDLMIESIQSITEFYKGKKFFYLGIQLYMKVSSDSEYIDYHLNKLYRIIYKYNSSNTKSSLEINLLQSNEEIFKDFSKGHKSNIKKAPKLGLKVDMVNDYAELASFAGVYTKMCHFRKIHDDDLNASTIIPLYEFLKENGKGEILIIKDSENVIIGGAILVYQGITVRYFKGTSDPDRRDVPVAHIVLFEAIMRAKQNGYQFFDFWGYNHFVGKNDQVYSINIFKKGFGGYFTFFPKKININLIPFGFKIITTLKFIKNFIHVILKKKQ